jgi:hypothetical protein
VTVPIAAVDNWEPLVKVPDDGEDANSWSLEYGVRALADRTLWLRNRLWGAGYNTLSRIVHAPLTPLFTQGFAWDPTLMGWVASDQTSVPAQMDVPVPTLPEGAEIVAIVVTYQGVGTHATVTALPSFEVRTSYGSGTYATNLRRSVSPTDYDSESSENMFLDVSARPMRSAATMVRIRGAIAPGLGSWCVKRVHLAVRG